ncbi:serine hydrolase domain-containing protein [Robiginitomaculum antarcticum]|uniref:serine hydrolase domain-containing protein n=1 Tax=Robiginitomaculum antarcticum TaxID=437507 RepID=UPI0014613802|nr:serine hydrolase [Robiginitomaculum antarcticum]
MKKIIALIFIAALLIGGGVVYSKLAAQAPIAVGYQVKVTCSEVFVAGRDFDTVTAGDFNGIHPLLNYVSTSMDAQSRVISGHLFGLGGRKAVYRGAQGCLLLPPGETALPAPVATDAPTAPAADTETGPELAPPAVKIDPGVQAAVMALFDDSLSDHAIGTRAVVVMQNGVIIGEHYADGFNAGTPMQSWSMAKSITHALYGAAQMAGYLDIEGGPLLEEWAGDERAAIKLRDMFEMQSGLAFDENYGAPSSHVNTMLWAERGAGRYAASLPLSYAPGAQWSYSSGTSNILALILRRELDVAGTTIDALAQDKLFGPVGIDSAVVENDFEGTPIGSSFVYMTARDWAAMGQLYLNDGMAGGTRILPQGWTDMARRPAAQSGGVYGSHFWLNLGQRALPGLPEDAYYMGGHDHQRVIILPGQNAVIVKLGITRAPADMTRDVMPRLAALTKAL